MKKKAAKKPVVRKKADSEAKLLARYQHHNDMASKHRAHADLIEAKLRVHGKRIDRYGDTPSPQKQLKIVSVGK